MRYTRWGVFAALLAGAAVVAALVGTTGSNAAPTKKTKVVIGWAYDSSGQYGALRQPGPGCGEDRSRAHQRAQEGQGHLRDQDLRHTEQRPDAALSRARSTCSTPARTSSSRPATSTTRRPSSRRRSSAGKLAVSTCIGTDQMGPKRFGTRPASSRSASATSPRTRGRQWPSTHGAAAGRRPGSQRTRLLVYFRNVVTAFEKRFKQLGGRIVDKESYATGQNNVGSAVEPS